MPLKRLRERGAWVALFCVAITGLAWGAGKAWGRGGSRLRLWARELETLRSQVDSLDAQVREARTAGVATIRALVGRRGELQLQLDREEVRHRSAQESVKDLKTKIEASRRQGDAFIPVAERALRRLKEEVRQGMPYRVKERLAALGEVEGAMKAGRLSPEAAVAKLWRFVEDELRLTQEVMLTKLPLTLKRGKARRMVRVARLGMVALFTELGDGAYGHFVKDGEGRWRHERLEDKTVRKQVARLFEALERNILEGAYSLPLPPVSSAETLREGLGDAPREVPGEDPVESAKEAPLETPSSDEEAGGGAP